MVFLHDFTVTVSYRNSLLFILLQHSGVALNICKKNGSKLAVGRHNFSGVDKFKDFERRR
jgi:hypothetical protein